MREDRGYICANEIDLNAALPVATSDLIRAKTTPAVAKDICLLGKRFTARAGYEAGFVD